MDVRTGEIVEKVKILKQFGPDGIKGRYIEMRIPPTPAQMKRRPPKVGRNEPCPCGSGKKFKKCCLTRGEKE